MENNVYRIKIPWFNEQYGSDWDTFVQVIDDNYDELITKSFDFHKLKDINYFTDRVAERHMGVKGLTVETTDTLLSKKTKLREFVGKYRKKGLKSTYLDPIENIVGIRGEVYSGRTTRNWKWNTSKWKNIVASDSYTWTPRTSQITIMRASCYDGTQFITAYQEIQVSTDGVSWSTVPISGVLDPVISDLIYDGSQYVAVGRTVLGGALIMTSPDLSNWTARLIGGGTLSLFESIVYDGSQYVVVGVAGYVYTSQDSINWTSRNSGTNVNFSDVIFDGSQYIAVSPSTTYVTSPDGINWTVRTAPSGAYFSIAYDGNTYVAVGGEGGTNGRIITSSDSINWQVSSFIPSDYLVSIINVENGFIAVGIDGIIVVSGADLNWSESYHGVNNLRDVISDNNKNNETYLASGDSSSLYTSNGLIATTPSLDDIKWSVNPPRFIIYIDVMTTDSATLDAIVQLIRDELLPAYYQIKLIDSNFQILRTV